MTGDMSYSTISPSRIMDRMSSQVWQQLLCCRMVILATYYAAQELQRRKRLPPGPRPRPILRNLLAFRDDFHHKVLQKLATNFSGLMCITLGCQRCIVVSTAAVARGCSKLVKIFLARSKTYTFQVISDNFTDWITAVDTQHWQQVRKFRVNGLLSSAQLTSQHGMRTEEVHHVMKCIVEDCKYLKEFRHHMAIVGEKVFHIQAHKNRQADLAKVQESKSAGSQCGPFQPDFLDELLAAQFQDGKPFPAELLALNLLEGGTESLSNTTEWAMSELMRRLDLLKQLQAEFDVVVGSNLLVQEAHIANLPILQAVVKESMRLYPGIPLVPRKSHEQCQIQGYTIPANTKLVLTVYAIQRDPKVYTNPDKFDPTRFLHNHQAAFNSYELLQLGRERRMCPGFSYATTMVSFLVANFVHSFEWTLPEGQTPENLDMSEAYGLAVLRKRFPLSLIAKRRSPASLYYD